MHCRRSGDLKRVEATHLTPLLDHLDGEGLLPLVRVSEDGDNVPHAVEETLGSGGVNLTVVEDESGAGDGDDLAVLAADLNFLNDDVLESNDGAVDGLVDGLLVLEGGALDGAVEAAGLKVGGHVNG